jgi:hypothetical protein
VHNKGGGGGGGGGGARGGGLRIWVPGLLGRGVCVRVCLSVRVCESTCVRAMLSHPLGRVC